MRKIEIDAFGFGDADFQGAFGVRIGAEPFCIAGAEIRAAEIVGAVVPIGDFETAVGEENLDPGNVVSPFAGMGCGIGLRVLVRLVGIRELEFIEPMIGSAA